MAATSSPPTGILVWDTVSRNVISPTDHNIRGEMSGVHARGEQEAFLSLLREVRDGADLTQADLAERLGRPQSFVSKVESGERRVTVLELREICRAYGISPSDFMRRLDNRIQSRPDRKR
jgi:ribosome-binding protein aMBF1 (putative translation factor)